MQRRSFLKQLATGAAMTIPSASIGKLPKAPLTPKVVLFILADDMRWDAINYAGYHQLKTPNLDSLAGDGFSFQNNFVTTSICPTSRASILTGQYARRHQIWDFSTQLRPDQIEFSLPRLLQNAGYKTAFFGKWGIGHTAPTDLFDHWEGFMGQGQYEADNGQHLTDRISNEANRFIEQTDEHQPVALFVNSKAPHVQDDVKNGFLAANRFNNLYSNQTFKQSPNVSREQFSKLPDFLQTSEGRKRWETRFATEDMYQDTCRKYHRLIAGLDELVGSLTHSLKSKFGANNLLTVFSSDNGFLLGEHGLAGKWWGFEESIRTPLIINAPFLDGSGLNTKAITSISLNIDIAPTILALVGAGIPASMQGKSLLPEMLGQGSTRKHFFYEHLFAHPRIAQTIGVRTSRYKYLQYTQDQSADMLFDLTQDPFEMQNLASCQRHKNIHEALRAVTKQMESQLR